jgi:hypothetical protein
VKINILVINYTWKCKKMPVITIETQTKLFC